MRCPSPIDWLEYLEGGSTEELKAHLRECQPCRILVEELRRDATNREPLRLSIPPATQWPRWNESATKFAAYGEIWWSAWVPEGEALPGRRVPLLVASHPWKEHGDTWFEVVPLSSDVENATAVDLQLLATDTNLGVPWRALFRYQTIVRQQQLDARIGQLTDGGRSLIDEVVAQRAPEGRFGVPIADAYDERLSPPEDVELAIRLLGRPFAEASERADVGAAREHVQVYEFKRIRPTLAPSQMKLAADSAIGEQVWVWSVEIPRRGRIGGRIEHQPFNDELSFAIDEVAQEERGLQLMIWILVWSDRLSEPIASEPFVPEAGRRVLLGHHRAIVPGEITRMQLRLSDDT